MVLVLSGTKREGSVTRDVAEFVANLHPNARLLALRLLPQAALDGRSYGQRADGLAAMIEAVLRCSGLVVVTPEYNGSFPGALKLFIDLLSFPQALQAKPCCFVGLVEGQWGARRAVEHLQPIFVYRQAILCPNRVFNPDVGRARDDRELWAISRSRLTAQAAESRTFMRWSNGIRAEFPA